jgi:L-seryl-tRNA(Ser) seleniumtransferase
LGRSSFVDPIKKNPLHRAFRIDKLTLAALEATLMLYRREEDAMREIPTLAMLAASPKTLAARARKLKKAISRKTGDRLSVEIVSGSSRVGGGALPTRDLPTRLVALNPHSVSVSQLEQRLRLNVPPIICRIERERVLMDVRTIQDEEISIVGQAVDAAVR